MKLKIIVLALIGIFFSFENKADADWRSYVWTYEYQTMHKGTSEIEYYETMKVPDVNNSDIKTFQHWLEYEYGLTDHLDLAIYQLWKTKDKTKEADTKYNGTKLRFRYRLGEKNKYLVDPLLYVEYEKSAINHEPHELELKLVLAKDMGNFNIAYNQILNQALESDGVTESEYAFGLSHNLNNRLRLGVESKGSYLKDQFYIGPTISFSTRKFWFAFGVLSGLNRRSDDLQTRVIAGIPF